MRVVTDNHKHKRINTGAQEGIDETRTLKGKSACDKIESKHIQ